MKVTKRGKERWITGVPESEDCGPYDTQPEAVEDMEGLERTERWGHLHQYWTTEKIQEKPVKKTTKKTTKQKKKGPK